MSAEYDLLTYRHTAMDDYSWVSQDRRISSLFWEPQRKILCRRKSFKISAGRGQRIQVWGERAAAGKFSKLLRHPTEDSSYEPDFGNWQFSDEVGVYAAEDVFMPIRLEQWMWYEYSTDRMQGPTLPDDFNESFNYREKRLKIKSRILYDNREKGLTTGLEFHADFRDPENETERKAFPYVVQKKNKRLTFTLGYRLSPSFHFTGGISYDIDRDRVLHKKDYTWFDGGFGRIVATW